MNTVVFRLVPLGPGKCIVKLLRFYNTHLKNDIMYKIRVILV